MSRNRRNIFKEVLARFHALPSLLFRGTRLLSSLCAAQVMEVLKTVAQKEGLTLPDAFAARLVTYSSRNLRRCEVWAVMAEPSWHTSGAHFDVLPCPHALRTFPLLPFPAGVCVRCLPL